MTPVGGGVHVDAERDITIGGDVVGHDKITTIGYTIEQVSTLLKQISSTFQPKPFDGRCPYLGLDYFSEDDADRFFGRETLVSELVARVKGSRFVVIVGPSGSGKSSLVRAGLIHALKQAVIPNSDRWLYAALTPGRDPIESLALAMSRMARSPDAGDYIRDHKTEAESLHRFAESIFSDRLDQRAVILVDQFEEVFTQVSKEDERAAFLNLLTHAATTDGGRITVLFALRSDFVTNCAAYPQLNTLLNQQFMQVSAMQPDELVSAIACPALQVGLRIDPDLVAQVVDDMQDEPGALPLMQFALKDLFDAQQARGGVIALTLKDYLARGGLHKALERHADAALARLSEDEQQLARTIFSSLIEIGRGTQDTRRTAAFDELVPANVDAAEVEAVVQKLADARLITTDEQAHRDRVTISHERLIEAWPWLHRLVNENRDAIALQNQIMEDAQEWDEHQRDASYLYRGARLATAHEDLAGQKITLSGLAQQFVEAGIDAFDSARRRRRRIVQGVIGGLVFVSLIFAGLSIWAVNSQQLASRSEADALVAKSAAEANAAEAGRQQEIARSRELEARSRELAAIALNQLDKDAERGLLIAIEAGKAADTYEAREVLRQLLFASRLRAVLRGHEQRVTSAQFSPNGKQIVTASDDGTARVWDAMTGKELAVLRGHEQRVTNAEFSPDGKQIVTASDDGTARMWDAAAGKELTVLRGHAAIVGFAQFSPDGKTVLTANADDTVGVWDAATGEELTVLPNGDSITSAQFSPDGKRIVIAGCENYHGFCHNKSVRVWDASSGQQLAELHGHTQPVLSAQFSLADGKQIVTASADGTARVWEAATGKELVVLRGHELGVTSAQFSPDGNYVVTASADDTARTWDAVTGEKLAVLRGHDDDVVSAEFSPDGNYVVTASADDTARVWDAVTGEELAVLRGHGGDVVGVQFSPDSQTVVTASEDGTSRVWDAATGREVAVLYGIIGAQFSPDGKQMVTESSNGTARVRDVVTGREVAEMRGHGGWINSFQFSPDGEQIVTANGGGDYTARVWDAATGKELAALRGHEGPIYSAQFSPDGRQVVTEGCDKGNIATGRCTFGASRVWDAATGKELAVLQGHDDQGFSARFSPDGQRIVTADCDKSDTGTRACTAGTARVWDAATRREVAVLRGHAGPVHSAQFSPDSQHIVTAGGDRTARVWDAATGKELAVLRGHESTVYSAQFSPDGQQIVTVGCEMNDIATGRCTFGTARVWDAATGKALTVVRGNEGEVSSAEFSPDGRYIVTGGCDKYDRDICTLGTAWVWDAVTYREVAVLRGHKSWINSVQFSPPDGRYIVTSGSDGTARIYALRIEDLIALAQSRVARIPSELTCGERRQYLHEDVVCATPTPIATSPP